MGKGEINMSKRNLNCDILRIIAFIFVIAVHSLSNINFYNTITKDITMLGLNILRPLFMTCVPLFIFLSGYLTKEREFNKTYVLKLGKILLTYLLCAIACLITLHFIEHREALSIGGYIISILSFDAAPYGWYVELYIGLYLLIPFLNKLWQALPNQKSKQNLILVLIFLFVLPTAINIYNINDLNWWLHPAKSQNYAQLMPNYWMGNWYPILYYYLGRYLKEYKLKIKLKTNILLIPILMILFGCFNFYRNYGSYFDWAIYVGNASFEVLIMTILIANLILNYKDFNFKSIKLTKFINKISVLTFGAYLLSRIFDALIYPLINNNTMYIKERVIYIIPTVIIIAILSLIAAYFIDLLSHLIIKSISYLNKKFIKLRTS